MVIKLIGSNVMAMKRLLPRVLTHIKPSKDEQLAMDVFSELLQEEAERHAKRFGARPMLCGSVAKNTWLSHHRELDLFLLFDKSLPREKLEEYGLQLSKDIVLGLGGRYRIAYTEHPYLSALVKHDGKVYDLDVVPCYDIEPGTIKSAVDRTPHHVRYIRQHIAGLEDDVRLLKQLCTAAGCYGADLRFQGFSGYLCELLILYYKGFPKAIQEISNWHPGISINFGKYGKSKFDSPLAAIDPVDSKRNVAAAVSPESFFKLVKACKSLLETPSEKIFFKELSKPYSVLEIEKEMKRRGTRWYLLRLRKPDVQEDILFSQARRTQERIETLLKENDFKVFRKSFYMGDFIAFFFEMETWILPKIARRIGPDIFTKHAKQFLEHYKDDRIYIEGRNWVVEYEREFISVADFFKSLLSRGAGELKSIGIPSVMAEAIDKRCEIASGGDAIRLVSRLPEDFRLFLKDYFEKNLNVVF